MVEKLDNWLLDAAAITSLDARMAGIIFPFLASMEKLESLIDGKIRISSW